MIEDGRKANIELDLVKEGPGVGPPGEDPDTEDPKSEHLEADRGGEQGDPPDSEPGDWSDIKCVLKWYGKLILKLSKRKESLARLRAISGALSTLASLIRLNADTSELTKIRAELDELRRQGERTGPRGIVK